jgi:serine/threonine-protein kinase
VSAAFVSTLLLLGIVGFFAGFVAAGSELERQGQIDPTTTAQAPKSPTPSPSPARPTPSPSLSPTPDVTATRADAFDMPDLVNKNFRDARNDAIGRKLGVNVVFNERSIRANGTVVRTNPAAGVQVFPGLTIQLYVAGPPPRVLVPDIVGKTCGEGKDGILDAGLKIGAYPSGEKGNVTKVEPAPGTLLSWNDSVKIFCA